MLQEKCGNFREVPLRWLLYPDGFIPSDTQGLARRQGISRSPQTHGRRLLPALTTARCSCCGRSDCTVTAELAPLLCSPLCTQDTPNPYLEDVQSEEGEAGSFSSLGTQTLIFTRQGLFACNLLGMAAFSSQVPKNSLCSLHMTGNNNNKNQTKGILAKSCQNFLTQNKGGFARLVGDASIAHPPLARAQQAAVHHRPQEMAKTRSLFLCTKSIMLMQMSQPHAVGRPSSQPLSTARLHGLSSVNSNRQD